MELVWPTGERGDAELLKRQYAVFRDEAKLVQTSKEAAEELELLLEEDRRQAAS